MVVDGEFFLRHQPNDRVLKEFAIFRVNKNQLQCCQLDCWLVKTPKLEKEPLPPEVKKHNDWLEKRFHKLTVCDGNICEDSAHTILTESLQTASFIFCKGLEKSIFFKQFVPGKDIHNLDLLGCPKIEDLKEIHGLACALPQHADKFDHCAQVKAHKFGQWLMKQPEISCTKCFEKYIEKARI